jgi:hypothetical protein
VLVKAAILGGNKGIGQGVGHLVDGDPIASRIPTLLEYGSIEGLNGDGAPTQEGIEATGGGHGSIDLPIAQATEADEAQADEC